jgi:tRNA (guanine37-N1)-methyltransferase
LLLNVSSTHRTYEGLDLRKRLVKDFAPAVLAGGSVVYSAFDIVGDIAIIKMPKNCPVSSQDIAAALMNRHKRVKAVFVQDSKVAGAFRLRSLTHVAGEHRTQTVHRESGCFYALDLETCYFSPKLSGERLRIAGLVQPGETVVNMFAGVGTFSILIAKRQPTAKIYSIDVNPVAVEFMKENARVNRVNGNVVSLQGDAKAIIEAQLQGCADRVLMPLPEKAYEYLPTAVAALKPKGGWIHLHTFVHATKTENPKEMVKQKVTEALHGLGVKFEVSSVRVVRSTGPNWWQLVADIKVNIPLQQSDYK